ncbi:MAG: hypothetical protein J1E83_01330 [Lachnospiraceae bacterium]|nr:hypothetical protein [Lachnospiraceae bacterium]
MKEHRNKMIAPIIITVLFVLYYIFYFTIVMTFPFGIWTFFLGIIPIALAVVMICVCIQRIKEIKEGEEDDLSKY